MNESEPVSSPPDTQRIDADDDDDSTGAVRTPESTIEPTGETADEPGSTVTPRFLIALRQSRQWRLVALIAATVLGVALAWVHWLGLFVAGGLVGLVSTSVVRALVAGVVVGVLVLLVNILVIPAMGAGEFAGLAPVSYVTVAVGIGAPLWGSLIRGVL